MPSSLWKLFFVAGLAAVGECVDVFTNIFVSSYDGNVTTLRFISRYGNRNSLTVTYRNPGCAPSPVWLQLDKANNVLYCLDEDHSANAFRVAASDGLLTRYQRLNINPGPVSSTYFNTPTNPGLAIAHYGGSAVSAFNVSSTQQLTGGQVFTFNLTEPKPRPEQEAPHPHQAILDPTGNFILVPDLGADLLRLFSINKDNNQLSAPSSFVFPAGSGPRHAAFWTPSPPYNGTGPLYLFVLRELDNQITSFRVTYRKSYSRNRLNLENIGTINTFGGKPIPVGSRAAEISVTPDNGFIVVSNRNDSSFTIPSFDPNNATPVKSDTLTVLKPSENGTLSLVQLAPAGGSFPRQFQVNQAGTFLVVGLQRSSRVVVMRRNIVTGELGPFAANVTVPGEVTTTLWDE